LLYYSTKESTKLNGVHLVNVNARCLESLVFQLTLLLLKTVSPLIFELLVAILPPFVAIAVLKLRLESIIAQ
jgi:hypothetical protein